MKTREPTKEELDYFSKHFERWVKKCPVCGYDGEDFALGGEYAIPSYQRSEDGSLSGSVVISRVLPTFGVACPQCAYVLLFAVASVLKGMRGPAIAEPDPGSEP